MNLAVKVTEVALERAGLLVMRWGCGLEDCCSEWQQFSAMQAVEHLVKLTTALFFVAALADGLQGDFQLTNRLRLQLDFLVLFQHGFSDVFVQRVQICRVWGCPFFSVNPFTFSQFCVTLATQRNWGVWLIDMMMMSMKGANWLVINVCSLE